MALVKIQINVGTGIVGSRRETFLEIESNEWEAMDENQREQMCMEAMCDLLDWNWEIV